MKKFIGSLCAAFLCGVNFSEDGKIKTYQIFKIVDDSLVLDNNGFPLLDEKQYEFLED